jgi:hypothetical protein
MASRTVTVRSGAPTACGTAVYCARARPARQQGCPLLRRPAWAQQQPGWCRSGASTGPFAALPPACPPRHAALLLKRAGGQAPGEQSANSVQLGAGPADSARRQLALGGGRGRALTSPGRLMVSCGERNTCSGAGQAGRSLSGATPQMNVRLRDWLTPKLPALSTPKRTCAAPGRSVGPPLACGACTWTWRRGVGRASDSHAFCVCEHVERAARAQGGGAGRRAW